MYNHFIKRFLDVLFCILVLPFLLIVFLVVVPLIVIEDLGSPFYNAERLGLNGKVFTMYKFRSMKMNSEDIRNPDGSTFNAENDPRLTKIGAFLRKSSIDELPQIFNVLKGDMSLIGPRPDLPEHEMAYNEVERIKLKVRPGITGYNQAFFRNTIPWKERLKNDVYYVKNISFLLDFKIFIQTLIIVLLKKNIFILDNIEEK